MGLHVFGILCDRLGSAVLAEDVDAVSYRGICHPDAQGQFATRVTRGALVSLAVPSAVDARELAVAKMEALAKHRNDLISALDVVFSESFSGELNTSKQGFREGLADFLEKTLKPNYHPGAPLPLLYSAKTLGHFVGSLGEDPEAVNGFSEMTSPEFRALAEDSADFARSVLSYPRLSTLLSGFAAAAPLQASAPSEVSAQASPPSSADSLNFLPWTDFFLRQDDAFASAGSSDRRLLPALLRNGLLVLREGREQFVEQLLQLVEEPSDFSLSGKETRVLPAAEEREMLVFLRRMVQENEFVFADFVRMERESRSEMRVQLAGASLKAQGLGERLLAKIRKADASESPGLLDDILLAFTDPAMKNFDAALRHLTVAHPREGERSGLDALLDLLKDARGISLCNRSEGRLLLAAGDLLPPLAYPLQGGMKECSFFRIDDFALFYLGALAGQARIHFNDDFLKQVLNVSGMVGLTADRLLETSSGIPGFTTTPTPLAINSLLFPVDNWRSDAPASKTRNFLRALMTAPASSVCPQAENESLRRCRALEESLPARHENAVAALSNRDFLQGFAPVAKAFAKHKRLDLLADLLVDMSESWQQSPELEDEFHAFVQHGLVMWLHESSNALRQMKASSFGNGLASVVRFSRTFSAGTDVFPGDVSKSQSQEFGWRGLLESKPFAVEGQGRDARFRQRALPAFVVSWADVSLAHTSSSLRLDGVITELRRVFSSIGRTLTARPALRDEVKLFLDHLLSMTSDDLKLARWSSRMADFIDYLRRESSLRKSLMLAGKRVNIPFRVEDKGAFVGDFTASQALFEILRSTGTQGADFVGELLRRLLTPVRLSGGSSSPLAVFADTLVDVFRRDARMAGLPLEKADAAFVIRAFALALGNEKKGFESLYRAVLAREVQ